MSRNRAFTLVELLVVIAIIGSLVALLLPAVQAAREAGRRSQCQNQIRQLAIAAHNFHDVRNHFPPGVYQLSFAGAPRFRGVSLFVDLLPYIQQRSLAEGWDRVDPLTNTVGAANSRTAKKLPVLICPSDVIPENPINSGSNRWYGLTSYGGNGGSRSYDPQFATNDGVFFVIGPGSQTAPSGVPVRMADVLDGLSNTALLGERSHFDPNHDSFAANISAPMGQIVNPMGTTGWWAPSGGRLVAGDVTMSAYAPINFRTPANFANGGTMTPPATDFNSYLYYHDRKICAFGSLHPGGANFALGDGSTRFIAQTINLLNLQRLCVRNDAQPVLLD
jgi:prepilin-type N-terminal cleavage/methylation domain-containing protein/prepilin-type processing-associated H-X9-DG protein